VHWDKLQQLLMRRPMRTAPLLAELGISQPTFSRLWSTVDNGIAMGAGRARQYALRRQVPGVTSPVPLFEVSQHGQAAPIGHIDLLQGGFYAFTPIDTNNFLIFEGMPYFLQDLRPQGFLGRMEPGKNPDLDLPADILRWTNDQVLKYISRRSEHAPGDLIFGNESYARYIAHAPRAQDAVIPAAARAAHYPGMADSSMQGEPPDSSAGGEQPKFTAVIGRDDGTIEHVIVKFSPQLATESGRRWGDLLIAEHLALCVLAEHGIAAARTAILHAGGRMFLEVIRFDRTGLLGRLPMATFAALDGDLGMQDRNWTAIARELARLGELSAADTDTVEILDLFGALIGNTDKHHGNIALAWTMDRRHTLLDAYAMLPKLYRPNTHGEIIPRQWEPTLGVNLALRHLPRCYEMATQYWDRVLADPRISADFKQTVATPHLGQLRQLGTTLHA
jgi:hypothetical protein